MKNNCLNQSLEALRVVKARKLYFSVWQFGCKKVNFIFSFFSGKSRAGSPGARAVLQHCWKKGDGEKNECR